MYLQSLLDGAQVEAQELAASSVQASPLANAEPSNLRLECMREARMSPTTPSLTNVAAGGSPLMKTSRHPLAHTASIAGVAMASPVTSMWAR